MKNASSIRNIKLFFHSSSLALLLHLMQLILLVEYIRYLDLFYVATFGSVLGNAMDSSPGKHVDFSNFGPVLNMPI